MNHKLTDPVALDLIADLLCQHTDWGTDWEDIIQGVADIVEATGRDSQYEE